MSEDPPDLLERWLVYAEALLKRSRFSSTELEATRIGLRKWCGGRGLGREHDKRAVAMMKRLDEAEPRAWRA